jgi:hypothetical protein
VEVLKVTYDDQRRPVKLSSGLAEHRLVYDKVTGLLFGWQSNSLNLGAGGPSKWETWVWGGLALVQRGNEVYVNEAHVAGGMTLMSRTLEAPASLPTIPAVSPVK